MPFLLVILAALWYFETWPFSVAGPLDFQTEYMAEVGYYQGSDRVWFVGSRQKKKEACIDEAVSRFNSLNRESPRRAFSWSCRIMRGERFLDRTR